VGQAGLEPWRDASSRAPLGIINVILAVLGWTGSYPSRVMSAACPLAKDSNHMSKRVRMEIRLTLSFWDEDKVGTIQPHDDALAVTFRIGGMTWRECWWIRVVG